MDHCIIVKAFALSSMDSVLFHPFDNNRLRLNPIQFRTTFLNSTPKLTKRSIVFDGLFKQLQNPYLCGFATGMIESLFLKAIYKPKSMFPFIDSIVGNSIFFGLYHDKKQNNLKYDIPLSLSAAAISVIMPNINNKNLSILLLRTMLSRTFMTTTINNPIPIIF